MLDELARALTANPVLAAIADPDPPTPCDIVVGHPGSGKSLLVNTIDMGLCLSAMTRPDVKLPLIGMVDIGRGSEGFVWLVQQALGPERRDEATFVSLQLAPGFEYNVFDLQLGCDYPLEPERGFLERFLLLATLPLNRTTPLAGMDRMISLVIDEAYRLCTEVGGGAKHYRRGVEPEVDRAIDRYRIALHHESPYWREVVNGLFDIGEYRLAERAQRHAVPVLQDLLGAVRTEPVRDLFDTDLLQGFERSLVALVERYPTLNAPTQLDFGPARIIVLDLQAVAPTGSSAANRQTEMMYLLARHMLAANFFLHAAYMEFVPERVRAYHRARFLEIMETAKRIDYGEWHRAAGSPLVQEQSWLDARDARKHGVEIGFATQCLSDIDDAIISHYSTRCFVLSAGDPVGADDIARRFNLSAAGTDIVRSRLTGPKPGGAPVLALLKTSDGVRTERLLINSLPPVTLWALSTTTADSTLRDRLIAELGIGEALERLATIFPTGSARHEIERRMTTRQKHAGSGVVGVMGVMGVVEELTAELAGRYGLGLRLRAHDVATAAE